MSMDINRIAALLHIVKEASGHPAKLSSLAAAAMKELEGHSAVAKKELEEQLKAEAEEAAKVKAVEQDKAKKIAEEEAKQQSLALRPVARPAKEFEPKPTFESGEVKPDFEPVRRREVPEEVNHGA
jgi:Skp family chaperone for outer membrane proteins